MNPLSEYKTFDDLLSLLNQYDNKYDMNLIEKAFSRAKLYHGNQKRVSGVPYILHPISVAYILAELGMDSQSIVAALLHDVVEDTSADTEEIKVEFGDEISKLVDGVTKFKIIDSSEEEQRMRSIRKMLIAMSQDIRVIIIKLIRYKLYYYWGLFCINFRMQFIFDKILFYFHNEELKFARTVLVKIGLLTAI